MREIFANTGYWIALIDRRDQGRGGVLEVSIDIADRRRGPPRPGHLPANAKRHNRPNALGGFHRICQDPNNGNLTLGNPLAEPVWPLVLRPNSLTDPTDLTIC